MCPFTVNEFRGSDSIFKPVHKRYNFPPQSHRAIRPDRFQLIDQITHIKSHIVGKQVVSVRSANKRIQSAEHLFHYQCGYRVDCQGYTQPVGRTEDWVGLD